MSEQEKQIEPKFDAYPFERDVYQISTGREPFRDVELEFSGDIVWVFSKKKRTKAEFQKIYDAYLEWERKLEESTIKAAKIIADYLNSEH